jgi:hypothetical protein
MFTFDTLVHHQNQNVDENTLQIAFLLDRRRWLKFLKPIPVLK